MSYAQCWGDVPQRGTPIITIISKTTKVQPILVSRVVLNLEPEVAVLGDV